MSVILTRDEKHRFRNDGHTHTHMSDFILPLLKTALSRAHHHNNKYCAPSTPPTVFSRRVARQRRNNRSFILSLFFLIIKVFFLYKDEQISYTGCRKSFKPPRGDNTLSILCNLLVYFYLTLCVCSTEKEADILLTTSCHFVIAIRTKRLLHV